MSLTARSLNKLFSDFLQASLSKLSCILLSLLVSLISSDSRLIRGCNIFIFGKVNF